MRATMSICGYRIALRALVLLTLIAPAMAQPSGQPITIVVAAAAGGFADGVARVIGERIAERLGNHVGAMAATVSPLIVHINAGKLRGIGIASAQRFAAVPQVPTYVESGFTGFTAASWVGFFVPAKADAALVAKLNAAINE